MHLSIIGAHSFFLTSPSCLLYNRFVRYHLGLIIPHNNINQDSFLRVRSDIEKNSSLSLPEREALLQQGTFYYWHEGEGMMFDDNQLHDATNNSDEVRVVLFLDVARKLPWYLDIVNRIAIFVANRQPPIVSMRKYAILDENRTLSVG
jgi:aspartyl/asparaginyl beta-hydroxylase (cupin superfamily)